MKKQYCNKKEGNAQAQNEEFPFSNINRVKLVHFECIDSTNNWAKSHLNQWDENGLTLVTASEQTAGRGRFKRRWESPPHLNIYATFCFWIDSNRQDIGHIPQLLALVAAETLLNRGFHPRIKWPNDLLLSKKKVAGILCETVIHENHRGVICGIGLNVNMPKEILDQIDRPATSLLIESGQKTNPEEILEDLKVNFINGINIFIKKGFSLFFPRYQHLSYLKKGELVQFHDNQQLIKAQFDSLLPNGSIQLILPNGISKIYYAGEFVK